MSMNDYAEDRSHRVGQRMNMARCIREDRIRRLQCVATIPDGMGSRLPLDEVEAELCRRASREIALKLMEYRKVLISRSESGLFAYFEIEVIIPTERHAALADITEMA